MILYAPLLKGITTGDQASDGLVEIVGCPQWRQPPDIGDWANAGLAGCVANAIGDFSAGGSTLPSDLFNALESAVMDHRMFSAEVQRRWWQEQLAGERAALREMQAQWAAIQAHLKELSPDDPARPPEPALVT